MLRPHTIMPPRCACGSRDVEHGYNFERHGYLQTCEVCGLEMFWSSDMLTVPEVDAMCAAFHQQYLADHRAARRRQRIETPTRRSAQASPSH